MGDGSQPLSEPTGNPKIPGQGTDGLLLWEKEIADRYLHPAGGFLAIGCSGGRDAFALAQMGH